MQKLIEKAEYLKMRTEVVAPKEDEALSPMLREIGNQLGYKNGKYWLDESAVTINALREHVKEQQKFIKKLMKELEKKN